MTIPNSFSTEDLENAMKSAMKDSPSDSSIKMSDEAYQKKIIELAQRFLNQAFEELPDALFHKAIAVMILQNLCAWHEKKAEAALQEGEPQLAGLWARDGGQLTAALSVLANCSVSSQDFIAGE